jgi:hypothetical protein
MGEIDHNKEHIVESHTDVDVTGRKNKSRLSWSASGETWDMGNPEAEQMRETVIYDNTISVGDPVYLTGYDAGEDKINVGKADASNAAKMPAIGVAIEAGVATNQKEIGTFGRLNNTNTVGLSINDPLYVAAGGGMISIKPTGTNLVQKIAQVTEVDASGNVYIIGAGRTNDVPNLTENKAWYGDTDGVPQETTLESTDGHLTIEHIPGAINLTVNHTICYFPTGIEFGNTTQEYDVDGVTWVNAVAGGTLGGIPDEASGGHELAACILAVTTALDDSYLAVREGTGAASATNPGTVHFLFTGITEFDTLDLRMLYSGSISHIVGVEFWNYTTSAWVRVTNILSSANYIEISDKVFGSTNFIGTGGDEGDVKLQIIHDASGNAAHGYEFDLVSICNGGGGGGAAPTVTEFTDNTFRVLDEIDNTKEIAFQASSVPTGTTKTIIMADADVDLSDVNTLTYAIKAIADDTALASGDGLAQFTLPNAFDGMDLIDVEVKVYTASTSGLPSFQFYNLTKTQDMLSTNLTIDANETDSSTATTAAVIDTGADDVSGRDVIRIDCDAEGTGTAGAEFEFVFKKP